MYHVLPHGCTCKYDLGDSVRGISPMRWAIPLAPKPIWPVSLFSINEPLYSPGLTFNTSSLLGGEKLLKLDASAEA